MTIEVIMKNQQETTIGASYDLVTTTLGELREKLLEVHRAKEYPNMDIDIFNKMSLLSQTVYGVTIRNKKLFNDIKEQFIKRTTDITPELQEKFTEYQSERKVQNNTINYDFILGSTFIDIEEDENGNWYLLDGFRRTFVNKALADKKIFIRKFNKLTNAKWLEYMITANMWKQSIDSSFTTLINRGFMYSIYHRSGIAIPLLSSAAYKAINQLLGVAYFYEGKRFLEIASERRDEWDIDNFYNLYFTNNNEFFNDLLFIENLDKLLPNDRTLKIYTGKRRTEVREHIDVAETFLKDDFFSMIVGTLGEARKFEAIKGLERKQLKPEEYIPILDELLEDSTFTKSIFKITELYTDDSRKKNKEKLAIFIRDYILTNVFNYNPEEVRQEVPIVKSLMRWV